MKRTNRQLPISLALTAALATPPAEAQASGGRLPEGAGLSENVTVLGTWDGYDGYTSVHAHATGGVSFAIVGTHGGTAFVDVSDPASPIERAFIAADAGPHVAAALGDVAYLASAGGGGLLIVDLSSPTLPGVHAVDTSAFTRAVHLAVDTGAEVLYAAGTDMGLVGLDLADPRAPASLFDPLTTFPAIAVDPRRPHAYVVSENALAVLDVFSPPTFRLLAWVAYPRAKPSSIRLGEDLRHVLVGDAASEGGSVRIFDVGNPLRVAGIGEKRHDESPDAGALDVDRDASLAYVAWGDAGLEILDTTDDAVPLRVGAFRSGSSGASGVVAVDVLEGGASAYVLDGDAGLSVLSYTPVVGEVTGLVMDRTTDGPAPGVIVRAVGTTTTRTTETGVDGTYRLVLTPGDHDVHFEGFRFVTVTQSVTINSAEAATVDVTLDRHPVGTLRGTVNLARSGGNARPQHPEGTIVRILGTPIVFPAGFSGFYIVPGLPVGTYVAEADRFGYDAQQFEVTITEGVQTLQDFDLVVAPYADNLEEETGWVTGDASDDAITGAWSRAVPIGTGAGYVQPDADETPEPGTMAFVTGNGPPGGWIEDADVDGGTTTVTSPPFDVTDVGEPIFRFYRWFSNDASWNDEQFDADGFSLEITTDGGESWTVLETLSHTVLFWEERDYVLSRHVPLSDVVQLRVRVADIGAPSIVEASFDDVEIWDGAELLVLPPPLAGLSTLSATSAGATEIRLQWMAAGTYDRFDVERQIDDGPREVIGKVSGSSARSAGPGTETFAFTDVDPRPGVPSFYWIVGVSGGETERLGPVVAPVTTVPATRILASRPNPASGPVTFEFQIGDERGEGDAVRTRIHLFDVHGRRVGTLDDTRRTPGRHTFTWDGRDARGRRPASGVYWLELETERRTLRRKIVLVY